MLNGQMVRYHIKYSRKAKYIRIQVRKSTGLEVIIPARSGITSVDSFLTDKSGWILKHLKKFKEEPGFLFLGSPVKVKQYYQLFITKHKFNYSKNFLEIRSPEESTIPLEQLFNAWLRYTAKKYLSSRTHELACSYGFNYSRISVRGQKTRWGSCSSQGNINFNFNLMRLRKELIDYVIIHELCHLKEMNHSKNFWALVNKYCPRYKQLRKELKQHSLS